MISDTKAKIIYISDLLESCYPVLVHRLRGILEEHEILLKIFHGTREIWCRDYMPVQVETDRYVRFRYAPNYPRGVEHLITCPSDINPINEIEGCEESEIVLDGDNVVRWGSRCLMTDRLCRENPALERNDLQGKLREVLRVDEVIVIPKEPYDLVGHVDGVVRFLYENLVLINDYSEVAPWYRRGLVSILRRAGLDWVEIPYCPQETRGTEIPSTFGCYANFLMVRVLVFVPTYDLPEDDLVCRIVERHAGEATVVTLDCGKFPERAASSTASRGR